MFVQNLAELLLLTWLWQIVVLLMHKDISLCTGLPNKLEAPFPPWVSLQEGLLWRASSILSEGIRGTNVVAYNVMFLREYTLAFGLRLGFKRCFSMILCFYRWLRYRYLRCTTQHLEHENSIQGSDWDISLCLGKWRPKERTDIFMCAGNANKGTNKRIAKHIVSAG